MSKLIEMIGEEPAQEIEEFLSLMADRTRMDIILLFLEKREWNAGELAERFDVGRATVSHHVNLLVRGGVLTVRRVGKERYYQFRKPHVIGLISMILATLSKCC